PSPTTVPNPRPRIYFSREGLCLGAKVSTNSLHEISRTRWRERVWPRCQAILWLFGSADRCSRLPPRSDWTLSGGHPLCFALLFHRQELSRCCRIHTSSDKPA